MLRPPPLSPPRSKTFRTLLRERRGVTLVEFAFVAPILLLTCFMSMQMALQLLAQWTLDTGVTNASRDVMIGNIYNNSANQQQAFIADICSQAALIASCTSSLHVNMAAASSFYNITPATVQSNGHLSSENFDPSTLSSGQYVLIQVAYPMPYLISWLARITGGSTAVLLSTVAFQNEPYSE